MPWGVAAAVVGAGVSANASKKASDAQVGSTKEAADYQFRQNLQNRSDQAPAIGAGKSAVYKLSSILGLDPGGPQRPTVEQFIGPTGVDWAGYHDAERNFTNQSREYENFKQQDPSEIFKADPGYQFRMDEGNKAIENAARARGQYFSPSTVKELTRFGQGFASNEFSNVYNRLAGVAGMGQTAGNTAAASGTNYANNVGNLLTGAANARGAASISNANTWGNTLAGAGNAYSQNQTLKQLMGNGYKPNYYGTGNMNTMNANDASSWWGG